MPPACARYWKNPRTTEYQPGTCPTRQCRSIPHKRCRWGCSALGKPQKKTAQNHAENGAGDTGGEFAGPCARRLRKFETQRPSDLAETGQHQINPGHILKRGITFRSPAFPNGKSSKGNGCLAEYPQAFWNQEGNSSTPCHTEQHGHPGRNPASVLYKFHRGACYRQSDKRKTATS